MQRSSGRIIGSVLLLVALGVLGAGCEEAKEEVKEEQAATTASSAEETRPISVGVGIPKLMLRTADDKLFDLNESIRNEPTVLIFYRGGWCPYCNMHLAKLQGIEAKIIQSGYQIIAISPDRPGKIRESIDKNKTNYLLLSDSNMEAAKAFGIAFKLDKATVKKYEEYGINLYDASGEKHYSLPVPSVFVVGRDEVIKYGHVDPDYRVRLEPDELLNILKANQ